MFFSKEQLDILEVSLSTIGLFTTASTNRIKSVSSLMSTKSIDIMKTVSDQLIQMIEFLQTLTTTSSANSTQSSETGLLLSSLITDFTTEFFSSGMQLFSYLYVMLWSTFTFFMGVIQTFL
jgi:hypothetical protein